MADSIAVEPYLLKAEESLASAENDHINGRYNSCASRCYYACFQAAVAALIQASLQPRSGQWGHEFVIGQFVGVLINRRKRFPATLRTVLDQNLRLRQRGDMNPIRLLVPKPNARSAAVASSYGPLVIRGA